MFAGKYILAVVFFVILAEDVFGQDIVKEANLQARKLMKLYTAKQMRRGKIDPKDSGFGAGSCVMGNRTVDATGYAGYVDVGLSDKLFVGMACGMCIEIHYKKNRKSSVEKYIGLLKEECGGCKVRDMLMTINITRGSKLNRWKAIPCPVTGNLQYKFREANQYWTQIEFTNIPYPIKLVQYRSNASEWVSQKPVRHADWFTLDKIVAKDGRFDIRIIDIKGNKVEGKTNGWNLDFQELNGPPVTTVSTTSSSAGTSPTAGTTPDPGNKTTPKPGVTTALPETTLVPKTLTDLFKKTTTGFMSTHLPSEISGSCELKGDVRPISRGYKGYAGIALNVKDFFHNARTCGMCMEIMYNGDKYLGMVKDECHGCPGATPRLDFDIAMAHDAIKPNPAPITWKAIPCPVNGNMVYRFKQKNYYWNKLTFHNYRYLIHSVVYRFPGESNWRKTKAFRSHFEMVVTGSKVVPDDGIIEVKVKDIYGRIVTGKTKGLDTTFTDFGVQQ